MEKNITIIIARARNGVIGINNSLPWKIPEDLAFFKRTTLYAPVIMGRKTHQSIGHTLPKRMNIIMTRDTTYKSNGCYIANSFQQALEYCDFTIPEIFIIGGAQIFIEALPLAKRILLTEIDADIQGNISINIPLSNNIWKENNRENYRSSYTPRYNFSFVEYLRRK